jgi:hypothetical protein
MYSLISCIFLRNNCKILKRTLWIFVCKWSVLLVIHCVINIWYILFYSFFSGIDLIGPPVLREIWKKWGCMAAVNSLSLFYILSDLFKFQSWKTRKLCNIWPKPWTIVWIRITSLPAFRVPVPHKWWRRSRRSLLLQWWWKTG